MKLYRNAIILLIVLGLLVAAVIFVQNKKVSVDSTDNQSESTKLIDISSDDLVKVTIANAGTEFVIEKKDKTWVLKEPATIKANSSALDDLVEYARSVSADKEIAENASDLSIYGLDKPAVLTFILKNGSKKVLEIGNQVPAKDGYYVRIEGSNKVYKMDSYTGEKLLITKKSIRDTALFTLDKDKVDTLLMEKGGKLVFSSKKIAEYQWELTAPIEGNANLSALSPMIEALSAMTAQEFIEDDSKDLGKYGLSNPQYYLEFGTASEKHKLYLGYEKTKGTDIYARLDNSKDVFTVAESSLNFLDKPLKEIIQVFVYIANIKDVSKIKVEMDGRVDNFDLNISSANDNEKDKFYLNGKDATVKDENNDQYFRKYYQALVGITLDNIEIGAKPQGTPEISITYTLKKGPSTMKVDFIPKDKYSYYVMRDGEYTSVVVKKSQFDQADGVRQTYKKLVELMNKQSK